MNYLELNEFVLLSLINTKLRDFYDNINDLCVDLDINKDKLNEKLDNIGYYYNKDINQYIQKEEKE